MYHSVHPHDRDYSQHFASENLANLEAAATRLELYEVAAWVQRNESCAILAASIKSLCDKCAPGEPKTGQSVGDSQFQSVVLRTLADTALRHAIGVNSRYGEMALTFQAELLREAGLWNDSQREEISSELERQVESAQIYRSPSEDVIRAMQALESNTRVAWRYIERASDSSSQPRARSESEYRCCIECEGGARRLLRALNSVGKSVYADDVMAWPVESKKADGTTVLEIVVPGDVAEDAQFPEGLARSEELQLFREQLPRPRFVENYTTFRHQRSAELELAGAARGHRSYESLVVDSQRIEGPVSLSREIRRLTYTECFSPQGVQFGYVLLYEHASTLELAQRLLTRLSEHVFGAEAVTPWAAKFLPYDRREELHIPPQSVENAKFRLLLELNPEIRDALRAVLKEDRELLLDLQSAQDDLRANVDEGKFKRADKDVFAQARFFDTSLTAELRIAILEALTGNPEFVAAEAGRLSGELSSLTPQSLNAAIQEHSLVWLAAHETERLGWLGRLVESISEDCTRNGIALVRHHGQRGFLVSLDPRVQRIMKRYMDRLDSQVTGLIL